MTLRRIDGLRRKTEAEISAGDRARAAHTGTQAIETIEGLSDDLEALGTTTAAALASAGNRALAAAVGITGSASNLGAFTNTFVPDNATVKAAIEGFAGNVHIKTRGLTRNLAEYGDVGQGVADDDTAAFLQAAADLTDGTINTLRLPAAVLYLNEQIDINAPVGRVAIIGEGRYATRIVTQVNTGTTTQKQFPFVIRNTIRGSLVQGAAFENNADSTSYYQNPLVFCNVSNLVLQDFISENSDQYGVGVFDDVVAAPGSRTALACNNVIIQNGEIINASQYGIQHFPKVRSNGLVIRNVKTVNCGRDIQALGNFEPAGIKCGQATIRTILSDIDIECAAASVGLSIGNYEDYTARNVVIRNPKKQAISISAGTHPNLVTRNPSTPGGATPAPYLPSHGLIDVEVNILHDVATAGVRSAPFISAQFGATAEADCVTASTSNITLSGAQTIAGVAVVAGNRVLVAGQTNAAQNGIYVAASGAWSRATDFDQTSEVTNNSCVNVTGGSNIGGWVLLSADPHTVGTTAQTWVPFNPTGPRIKAVAKGEVIASGSYSSFEGSFQFQGGIHVPDLRLDLAWTGGNTAGVSGSPAFPESVLLLNGNGGGKFINPVVNLEVYNPHYVKQSVFMALWTRGIVGGSIDLVAQNGGGYVFRAQSDSGVVNFNRFDVQDFNLNDDAAQAAIVLVSSSAQYHMHNAVYRQTTGVGNGDFWVLGSGSSPVYFYSVLSNNSMPLSVNPIIIYQMRGRRGTATLSAGTAAVSFALSEPDANYRITLAGSAGESFSYASKSATGFTINSGNGSSTSTVDWTITRDQ